MHGKHAWFHPAAWMIGFAAATAWTITLLAAVTINPGPPDFFWRLLTDVYLQVSVMGNIGCAFVAGLCIAQGVIMVLKGAGKRSA